MREFFVDEVINMPFILFGWVHYLLIIITCFGLLVIYSNRKRIYNISKNNKIKISLITAFILFINMKIYYISLFFYNVYDPFYDLPLHFCFIIGYIFIYSLFIINKRVYKMVYFLVFISGIPAILWPDYGLKSTFDSFLFYQYFISHHFLFLSNYFFFYLFGYEFSLKDIGRSFIGTNIILFCIYLFNLVFKTNYIFFDGLPLHILDLYPFLSNIRYPFLFLEIIGIVLIFIAYLPILIRKKELKKIIIKTQDFLISENKLI